MYVILAELTNLQWGIEEGGPRMENIGTKTEQDPVNDAVIIKRNGLYNSCNLTTQRQSGVLY